MITLPVKFPFQQAVYGSFPFWNRGYAVLTQSAGCRPEWLAEMRRICQRYGEPSPGASSRESLFALRLKCGPWMIVGAHLSGTDDHDRPGALAFHALFISRFAYRWAGADPFVFAGALRHDWSLADHGRSLPVGIWSWRDQQKCRGPHWDADPLQLTILEALRRRRRVVVHCAEPIDALAHSVWRALPVAVRRRATLATWAFDNANQFDLVGLPKLRGVALDSNDLIVAVEQRSGSRT
jgi:hypothetical protein